MHNKAGLYLHVPFCRKKCAYCDFYSSFVSQTLLDEYTAALIKEIRRWGGCFSRPIDTIYLGGGTPSLLGKRIKNVLAAVRESFDVDESAEITAEINPDGDLEEFLSAAKMCGINRLSIGVQSGNDDELRRLGRMHTAEDACMTVELVRKLGFQNISLDLMLGLPDSTVKSLNESIDFILSLNPEHISAYILKLEPNTRLYMEKTVLPDDEEQSRQYLSMCERFCNAGYEHYEISNFAKSGYESRHNLKYWQMEEYLGIGSAAHSFVGGKRFFYERDLRKFLKSPETVSDGEGGDENERLMLGLRLKNGVDISGYPCLTEFVSNLQNNGLALIRDNRLSLTDKGMLVSNSIITEILERIV